MNRNRLSTALAVVACLGVVLPPQALASSPSGLPDVALRPGGVLIGQVVDGQGIVQRDAAVSIQYRDQEIARTSTDQNGIFAAQGLRGGQYRIATDSGECNCRLWAPNTAPPTAVEAVMLVTDEEVVRGQWGAYSGGYAGAWLNWVKSHPYITAGVVAAAVAVPLAISNNDDGPNS